MSEYMSAYHHHHYHHPDHQLKSSRTKSENSKQVLEIILQTNATWGIDWNCKSETARMQFSSTMVGNWALMAEYLLLLQLYSWYS